MNSRLKAIQGAFYGTLNGSDFFEDIELVEEDKADFDKIIQRALSPIAGKGGKCGLCVVVEEPEADAPTNLPNPYMTMVRQRIVVLENIGCNRGTTTGTGKKCFFVAEIIHCLLWEQRLEGITQGPIWPGSPAIKSVGPIDQNQPDIVGVECNFEAHAPLPQPAKVATPTITNGSSLITIASDTAGAAFLYSLGSIAGEFPDTVYTAPFATPASGTIILACGTKSGYATSDVKALTV